MKLIIITAIPVGRGRYDAFTADRYLATTRSPLLDGARILAAQGADPSTPIALRHVGSDQISMRSTIGIAAGLVIEEGDRLILREYRPRGAVEGSSAADLGLEVPEACQGRDALL